MKPTKAYILRTPHPKSMEYSQQMAQACVETNTPYEYIEWFQGKPDEAWAELGKKGIMIPKKGSNAAAQCCFSGHIYAWKKILDSGEPGIILEHDGKMLHHIDIDIPDNMIVALGYKLENPHRYYHMEAGPPTEVVDVLNGGHEGSHAYAITPKTADTLIAEVSQKGCTRPIDNEYFLASRKTAVPIKIMSPTPAIGWIRDSTIQKRSGTKNYPFIRSFKNHYE